LELAPSKPGRHRLLIAALLCSSGAHAGPPLSIDDPGILDPGQAEIILAGTVDSRQSGTDWFFPVLDVSYGLTPDVQLAFVATRVVHSPEEGPTKSDFGPGAIGVKWRFLHGEALQMSVAPYYEMLLRDGAEDRGVIEDVDAWVIPVEVQYDFESWRINGEARYATIHDDRDQWGYGVAATFAVRPSVEAMVELHGGADRTFDENGLLYRVGIDFAVSDSFHVLASAGSGVTESGDDDLRFQGYLGLQWFR
jgi:outer membrane receptor protein involved in Fe transport